MFRYKLNSIYAQQCTNERETKEKKKCGMKWTNFAVLLKQTIQTNNAVEKVSVLWCCKFTKEN
jgi:hypothetical protein